MDGKERIVRYFVENFLQWLQYISVSTVLELLDAILCLDKYARVGFLDIEKIYKGVYVKYGHYRCEVQEFRDYFGFMPENDVTFYKQSVYVYDEKSEEQFLELSGVFRQKYEKDGIIVNTIGELVQYLETMCKQNLGNVQILASDRNFELKGAITLGAELEYMSEADSAGKWLLLYTF